MKSNVSSGVWSFKRLRRVTKACGGDHLGSVKCGGAFFFFLRCSSLLRLLTLSCVLTLLAKPLFFSIESLCSFWVPAWILSASTCIRTRKSISTSPLLLLIFCRVIIYILLVSLASVSRFWSPAPPSCSLSSFTWARTSPPARTSPCLTRALSFTARRSVLFTFPRWSSSFPRPLYLSHLIITHLTPHTSDDFF